MPDLWTIAAQFFWCHSVFSLLFCYRLSVVRFSHGICNETRVSVNDQRPSTRTNTKARQNIFTKNLHKIKYIFSLDFFGGCPEDCLLFCVRVSAISRFNRYISSQIGFQTKVVIQWKFSKSTPVKLNQNLCESSALFAVCVCLLRIYACTEWKYANKIKNGGKTFFILYFHF